MRAKNNSATFWSKVKQGASHDCWEWVACRSPSGYGYFRWMGKNMRAHRVAYLIAKGQIPRGLLVRHSCDNPPCCNPSHLLLGTNAENNRDKAERKRARGGRVYGSKNKNAKLAESDVAYIWEMKKLGFLNREIALKLGRPTSTIGSVTGGYSWGHIREAIRGDK